MKEEVLKVVHQSLVLSNLAPNQIILDEEAVLSILNISKRKFGYMREEKQISYSQPTPDGKIYCSFQDILDYFNRGRVKSISSRRRL